MQMGRPYTCKNTTHAVRCKNSNQVERNAWQKIPPMGWGYEWGLKRWDSPERSRVDDWGYVLSSCLLPAHNSVTRDKEGLQMHANRIMMINGPLILPVLDQPTCPG